MPSFLARRISRMIFVVVFMDYLPNDLPNKYSIFSLFFAFDCKIYFRDRVKKEPRQPCFSEVYGAFAKKSGAICCER